MVAAWPRRKRLAALCSGGEGRWGRWSLLSSPEEVVRIGLDEPDPLGQMAARLEATALCGAGTSVEGAGEVPFAGGWMVAIGYELGGVIEPAARGRGGAALVDPAWPWAIVMWRCPWAHVHDHAEGRWWTVGSGAPRMSLERGDVEGRGCELRGLRSVEGRERFEDGVARIVEYIRAGDVFQANLSHRLMGTFDGSPRTLFVNMLDRARPWYGSYLEAPAECGEHFVCGMSPELFLRYEALARRVTTRPIKGTRRGGSDPRVLRESVKDQAELNMIVDLMRNDLGRVAEFGSVKVAEGRVIEEHGGGEATERRSDGATKRGSDGGSVLHGVATVTGTLRAGLGISDLLRATFPGGSITGAPKVRAMQIIAEIEGRARGLYTGAVGFISDCGNMSLNIAIRTAVVRAGAGAPGGEIDAASGAEVQYSVGAGIVADSRPREEWDETMDKARAMMGLAAGAAQGARR